MFVVGCHGDGRRRHYPWFLWGGTCPSPQGPQLGGGCLRGLSRGPFQAEPVCVVSDDSGPLGPSDFCLWEGVTATYSDCVGKTDFVAVTV